MYSRSYYTDTDISVPENYDGTVFTQDAPEEKTARIEPVKSEIKFSPADKSCEENETEECFCEAAEQKPKSFFGIDLSGILGGLFGQKARSSSLLQNIGTEEIIIIGLALFLLFSPSKDIECSLLLFALIFIK